MMVCLPAMCLVAQSWEGCCCCCCCCSEAPPPLRGFCSCAVVPVGIKMIVVVKNRKRRIGSAEGSICCSGYFY